MGTYTNAHEAFTRRGYVSMPVLPFLNKRALDDVAFAWITSLRPSSVRLCRNGQNDDARCWRVTVYLHDNEDTIRRISQEVEVGLPDGVAHGHALNLRTKVMS